MKSGLILCKWMDVGIVKEASYLMPLLDQSFVRIGKAGSATYMDQYFQLRNHLQILIAFFCNIVSLFKEFMYIYRVKEFLFVDIMRDSFDFLQTIERFIVH